MAAPIHQRHLRARHLIVAALVAVVIAVAGLALLSGRSPDGPPPPPEGPAPGSMAPGFSVASLANSSAKVSFGKSNGKPTVLTFFGSWCTNCRKDVGVLAKASRQLAGTVNFVGVDVADTRSAGTALVRAAGIDYPVAFDPEREVSALYDFYGLPAAVFVNGKGRLVHTVVGAITQVELDNWVSHAEA